MLAFNDVFQLPLQYSYVNLIPDDVWKFVFAKLDPISLARVELTHSKWKSILDSEPLLVCTNIFSKFQIFRLLTWSNQWQNTFDTLSSQVVTGRKIIKLDSVLSNEG